MSTWKKIKKIKRWVQRWRCQSLSKLHVNPGFCFPKYLRRRKGRRSQRLLRTKRKSRFCSRIKRQSRFCFTCGARTEDLAQKNLKKKTFPSRTTLREPRRVSFDFSAFCTGTDIYIYVQVFLKPIPLIEGTISVFWNLYHWFEVFFFWNLCHFFFETYTIVFWNLYHWLKGTKICMPSVQVQIYICIYIFSFFSLSPSIKFQDSLDGATARQFRFFSFFF
jgi:hypothetical protein